MLLLVHRPLRQVWEERQSAEVVQEPKGRTGEGIVFDGTGRILTSLLGVLWLLVAYLTKKKSPKARAMSIKKTKAKIITRVVEFISFYWAG